MSILKTPMQENDAEASTIGEYLKELLVKLWAEGEGFSGKRPFGNSGWEYELYIALGKAGLVKADFDEEYGDLLDVDSKSADKLIFQAIDELFEGKL